MNKFCLWVILALISALATKAQGVVVNPDVRTIEVTGASTVSITPDRIIIEIGMQEYFKKTGKNDSVKITLDDVENEVYTALKMAEVPDSMIQLNRMGNFYYMPHADRTILMGKTIQATLTDMAQLEQLGATMDIPGVTSFRIAGTDASDMEQYNRQGLRSALVKAREKARFIAETMSVELGYPVEIHEEGPVYYEEAAVADMAMNTYEGAAGMRLMSKSMTMDNMKKITRRYSVRVIYEFKVPGK